MVRHIVVVGLGYVGLPLAVALSRKFQVTGIDIDSERVRILDAGKDPTGEVEDALLKSERLAFTTDFEKIKAAQFVIVCVPTPINKAKQPDLRPLELASESIGKHIATGTIVVFESTVYPGVTEEVCAPIIERVSGLKCGIDFKVGYSPERINPGDKLHTIDKVTKVLAGMDAESSKVIEEVYASVTTTHVAPTIKVAEAAKVIENIQRDLNIALMNELKIIFDKLGVDIGAVLDAAGTKWNFHRYHPGLVGGHCIGVDPYYLTHRAQMAGYTPQIILAGRRTNDTMHEYYGYRLLEQLCKLDKKVKDIRLLVLGVTFKPDVPDLRNSRVYHLVEMLSHFGIAVSVADPVVQERDIEKIYPGRVDVLANWQSYDAVLVAVEHKEFGQIQGPACFRLNQL